MDADERRELLRAVADGEIEPAEAAALLGAGSGAGARSSSTPGGKPADDTEAIEHVRVRGVGAGITIIGDPTVSTIEVQGDHRLWSEGTTLVVRVDDSAPGRTTTGARRARGGQRRRAGRRDNQQGPVATIRMNPDLSLRVVAHLSAVEIVSISGRVVSRVNMGALTLRDVSAPVDLTLRAGRLKVAGRLTTGDSTIRTSMSKVDVVLDADSDVAVRTAVERGNVSVHLPGRERPAEPGCFVLGSGAATLDITARMGSISLAVDDGTTGSRR